jgi:alkylhydroperoxidase family enzyme
VDDELWNRLKQYYDDGQIIEIASAIGLFNYFNRVNDVLRMELTK